VRGNILSWCDRLASVPTVGFALTPNFAILDAIGSFAPILNPLVDQYRNPTFSMDQPQSGGLSITTKNGFVYSVDHSRFSVSFQHRMKATAVSGGPPTMEMLSEALPFTELLAQVSTRLIEAARLLPKLSERKIFQVGVVSVTRVAVADVPPGITKFIEYLGRPWDNNLAAFGFDVVSDFGETENWTDRCQHKLTLPEDTEELMTLSFDFQRRFKTGQTSSEAQMKTLLNKCSEDALQYFERLAEGDMFDEHIISSKTT
jgi:hypothetical protein